MPADGLAWHTPSSLTDGGKVARCYMVPATLLPMFNYLLDLLTEPENWYPAGVSVAATVQAASEFVLTFGMCPIGAVTAFATENRPTGWLLCDGSTVAQIDYPELAQVINPIHLVGSNIELPNLEGLTIFGANGSTMTYGDTGGAEQVTLTVDQLPAHSHNYEKSVVSDIDLELTGAPQPVYNAPITASTSSTGNGEPVDILPPFLVLNWYIFAGRDV